MKNNGRAIFSSSLARFFLTIYNGAESNNKNVTRYKVQLVVRSIYIYRTRSFDD